MPSVNVVTFAFDGVSLFHLSVPGLVFNAAQHLNAPITYQVQYCALKAGTVVCDQGLVIGVEQGLEALEQAHIIIWPDAQQRAPQALLEALQRAYARDAVVVGLCLGAFVLGQAGLLDNRPATTHWVAREAFAEAFPRSDFRPDVLYVADERVVTSAGTVAAIDCCLQLVRERHGANLANRIAQVLVTSPHRQGGQAQYLKQPVPQLPSQSRLAQALDWARAHLAEPINLDTLAGVARLSRRTFTRQFRQATGSTFVQWLTAERLARAQQLLETSALSIEQIAVQAGFSSAVSLRQHFVKHLGVAPSHYRQSVAPHHNRRSL